ncbi:hypothetical protein [Sneathiella glossodoripedis]|uniref:hypothetical protein n=1 Tax=Sneathiella glossodoripedis TaxID=418853 RepID=UPI00046FD2D7|nr:hypothetical protein [Sneathiella glossodoripedis]
MSKSGEKTVNLKELVAENLNGKRGFANTKKLRRLGYDAYCQWLEGELAKREAAKAEKSAKSA